MTLAGAEKEEEEESAVMGLNRVILRPMPDMLSGDCTGNAFLKWEQSR